MINELPVSLVITSIGEDVLIDNLINLTNSKPKINEILVIIPAVHKKKHFKDFKNVKYLFTEFKGQVKQRIYGFKNAKNDYILQLDCDCFISNDHISNLYSYLSKFSDKKHAIAPVYYCVDTKKPIHQLKLGFWSNLKNIITYFICGSKYSIFKMGTISKIGTNYGVDPDYMVNDVFISEWLPGGCVMHFKENLILKNYYKFTGKAYCEDLIHSFHLRKKNIQLLITNQSICKTEQPFIPKSYNEFIKYLTVQKYFWKLMKNKYFFQFYLWRILSYIRFLLVK